MATGGAGVFHEFKFKTAQCLQKIQDAIILKRTLTILYTKFKWRGEEIKHFFHHWARKGTELPAKILAR